MDPHRCAQSSLLQLVINSFQLGHAFLHIAVASAMALPPANAYCPLCAWQLGREMAMLPAMAYCRRCGWELAPYVWPGFVSCWERRPTGQWTLVYYCAFCYIAELRHEIELLRWQVRHIPQHFRIPSFQEEHSLGSTSASHEETTRNVAPVWDQ